jgi:hypothetical protein
LAVRKSTHRGLPTKLLSLVFGATISTTDRISVLSPFKGMGISLSFPEVDRQ